MPMRVSAYILFCLFLYSSSTYSQVEVGILRERPINSIMLQAKMGSYKIVADGKEYFIRQNDGISVKRNGSGLVARTLSLEIIAKEYIHLIPRSDVSRLRIRSSQVDVGARLYSGTFSLEPDGPAIKCSLYLPMEDYVAGVVKSESGKGRHQEYYKLQSIICRTYALANSTKHAHEGFQLCDQTHCQVFKGSCDYQGILKATEATKGQVLVDSDIGFIDATFHSNCGGETVNSEDVWSKEVSYLRSIQDKYCKKATHSTWRTLIEKEKWLSYLESKYQLNINDPMIRQAALNYSPICRDVYFANLFPLMPLEDIRRDWGLKSTYFSVKEKGQEVILEGSGFGHGVGMCQEGAMVMALTDRSFKEILHHYYNDVHVVNMNALDFFRDNELSELVDGPAYEGTAVPVLTER